MKGLLSGIFVFFAALAALSGQGSSSSMPAAAGREVFLKTCGHCHDAAIVATHRRGRDGWIETIDKMISSGAEGTEDEFNTVLDYLTVNFAPLINVNKDSAAALEAGLEITAKEAQAIVKYREEKGAIKTVEELKKVPGVDAEKIEAKKDRLKF